VVVVYIELPVVIRQVESWQGADAPCHFLPVAVDCKQFNARIAFFFCFSYAIVRRRKVAMRKGFAAFFTGFSSATFVAGIDAARA
jgi:hypothetical protein